MSAILGVFGAGAPRDDGQVRTILGAMTGRGSDVIGWWCGEGATLAVSRYSWQADAGWGSALIVEAGEMVVAADATLYYRDELREKLTQAGRTPQGHSPAHLIAAAYRAWGVDAVSRLEGDFAFVIYDRSTRAVICARDFCGRRPLHFADLGRTLVVASTPGGVRAHPDVPHELNLAAVALAAAGQPGVRHETSYRWIRPVPGGWQLTAQDGAVALKRWWAPPVPDATGASSFDDGAETLRELLIRAVGERLARSAPTCMTLSGGWDSPAVFTAGEAYLRQHARRESLRAVSISYPPGDSGREDELIETVLSHVGRTTRWIDSTGIPFLVDPAAAAAERDEPFAHMFEHWTRALARGARHEGCRVALDGGGGDQLFGASLLYLADLLRDGRWRQLRSELRAKGFERIGARGVFELLVLPLLPGWVRRAGTALRPSRSWAGPFDVHLPDWIEPDFVHRYHLLEPSREAGECRRFDRLADGEFVESLISPAAHRLFATYAAIGLDEGVDLRSPLHDPRIVEFAAGRPVAERTSGSETKRLLRHACAGWLPQEFLAPRRRRTGVTTSYARRAMRHTHAALISDTFARPVLADLGIVRPDVLRSRWSEFLAGTSRYEGALYLAFQTELWLRARLAPQEAGRSDPVTATAFA